MHKLREKIKKKETFLKYLISYMIVFFLPIMLILFHFYPETSKIIKDESRNSEVVLLSQINNYVSIQVNSIINCASTIHSDKDITSNLFMGNSEFNTFLIMQELSKIVGTNSFIERAFLYSNYNGKFYSYDGTISSKNFGKAGSSFYYENWSQEDIFKTLENTTDLFIRPSERIILPYGNNINAVTFILPIPFGNTSPYAVLMVVVKEESFFSFMRNMTDGHSGNILILNRNNTPLVKKNNADYLNTKEFNTLLNELDSGESVQKNLHGIDYVITKLKSVSPAFTYLSLTPVEDLLEDLNKTKRNTLILIFIIITVGLSLIMFAMRLNYRPLNTIKAHILNSFEQAGADDFECIDNAILSLQSENKDLVNRLLLNKNIVSEYFLIQLINGNFENEESVFQKGQEYNINLKSKICCFTFYATDRNTLQLLNYFDSILVLNSDTANCYLVKGMRHEDFTLILTFNNEENIKTYYEKIYNLDPQIKSNVKIGIGSVQEVSNANQAYTFSLVALEYAIINDRVSLLAYDDIDLKTNNDLIWFFDYLKSLEMAIYRCDISQMKFSMDNIIDLLQTKLKSVFKLRTVYITVHNLLIKELKKRDIEQNYIYDFQEIKNLDIRSAITSLEELFHVLVDKIAEKETFQQDSLNIEQIVLYLEDNYDDCNLSLQFMASKYNRTYSNFSHLFKKHANENFTTFLEKIRINKAKELLKSDLSIDKIALKVGYTNSNSFNRAFKKHEGTTPGEYRKTLESSK